MIYACHAELGFATTATRDAASTTITAALRSGFTVAARGTPGIANGLVVDGRSGSAIDTQAVYAIVAGLTTPTVGSRAEWHACYHGELAQVCAPGGSKAW